MLFDYLSGKMAQDECAVVFKGVDLMLKREDQNLARDEMAAQAEMRAAAAKRLAGRRGDLG